MYGVFDNGKPASKVGFPGLETWDNHLYSTFEEAKEYARKWLGSLDGIVDSLTLNIPRDYDGYGDTIEIREVAPYIPNEVEYAQSHRKD